MIDLILSQVLFGIPRIVDGDTMQVQGERVRLACIDAPEMSQSRGAAAKQALSQIVNQRPVKVQVLHNDSFGRRVGIVYQGIVNVNVKMVEAGQAFVFMRYLESCPATMQSELLAAARRARSMRLGIWADNPPQYPWQHRTR